MHLSFERHATKARVKRRTFHAPNLMYMEWNKELSLTLGSAHEKFDVWPWPKIVLINNYYCSYLIKNMHLV
jgi:hypothetical protein